MLSLNWAPLSVYLFLTLVIGEHNMPTVPKSVGRTVAPAPISTPVQSIQPANVQPLAQGISQLGDALLRKRNRDEQTEASILDAEYAQTIRTTMFGDGSEDNPGYLSSQGLDAERNVGDAENSLKEAQAILLEGKSVGIQRRLIPMFAQRNNSAQTLMGRHVQAQNKVAEQAASDSRINAAAEDAVLLAEASDAQDLHMDIGVAEIASRGREQGLEQVTIDEQTAAFVSAVHGGSIDSLISQGLLDQADAYLETNDEEMLSSARNAARDDIRIARSRAADAVTQAQITTQNEFLVKLEDNNLTREEILNSNLKPTGVGSKDWFLDEREKRARQGVVTNGQTFNSAFDRINLPQGDPDRIETHEELLEFTDDVAPSYIIKLRAEIDARDDVRNADEKLLRDQFLFQSRNIITKSNREMGITDLKGDQRYTRFLSEFLKQYNKLTKEEGVSPSDAIEQLQSLPQNYKATPQEAASGTLEELGIEVSPGTDGPVIVEPGVFEQGIDAIRGFFGDDAIEGVQGSMMTNPQFRAQGQVEVPPAVKGNRAAKLKGSEEASGVELPVIFTDVFKALALTESMNNPAALSTAGAIGRFQVMPPTLEDPGFGIKPAKKNPDGSFIMAEVDRVGQEYIMAMLKRYNNDMEASLIAYNAGPGNADKWLAAGRDYAVLPDRAQTEPYVQRFRKHLAEIENRENPTIDPTAGTARAVNANGETLFLIKGEWRRQDGTKVE